MDTPSIAVDSYDSTTVGLIDAIISISRVLAPRLKDNKEPSPYIQGALADLASDQDFQVIDFVSHTAKAFKNAQG